MIGLANDSFRKLTSRLKDVTGLDIVSMGIIGKIIILGNDRKGPCWLWILPMVNDPPETSHKLFFAP